MPGTLLIGFRNANGTYSVASAANPLPVTGGGGGGGSTSVTATAAAPTYVEGSSTNPLSVDLAGGLRVTGKVGIDQTTPGTTNGVVIKDSAGNAIDQTATVNTAADSSVMKLGATSVTPKFAAISSTGSGDTLALVSGKKIRVLSLFLLVAGATTVKFQSGATTDKTGRCPSRRTAAFRFRSIPSVTSKPRRAKSSTTFSAHLSASLAASPTSRSSA